VLLADSNLISHGVVCIYDVLNDSQGKVITTFCMQAAMIDLTADCVGGGMQGGSEL